MWSPPSQDDAAQHQAQHDEGRALSGDHTGDLVGQVCSRLRGSGSQRASLAPQRELELESRPRPGATTWPPPSAPTRAAERPYQSLHHLATPEDTPPQSLLPPAPQRKWPPSAGSPMVESSWRLHGCPSFDREPGKQSPMPKAPDPLSDLTPSCCIWCPGPHPA